MQLKAWRVTNKSLKWEYPFIYAPNASEAIREVMEGLKVEQRTEATARQYWTAVEMA